jgi:UDP-3-O-[3-hydroxymyristoyl] glucosamine N-acyltransferase
VLITPELAATLRACANRIIVARPQEAILALLPRFYKMPARPFTGVHPTAVVDPTASDRSRCLHRGVRRDRRRARRIAKGCWIGPHCVIGEDVTVGADTRLVSHVTLYPGARIGARVLLHAGVRIGERRLRLRLPQGRAPEAAARGRCIIGDDVEIGANSTIDRGSIDDTEIGAGSKLDNLVHVGHNCGSGASACSPRGSGSRGARASATA